MKPIFVLGIVLCFLNFAYGDLDPKYWGENLLRDGAVWHEKCMTMTGLSERTLQRMREGEFPERSDLKHYVACVILESKAFDKDFVVNPEVVKNYVPSTVNEKLVPLYMKCGEDIKEKDGNFVEKSFEMVQCGYKGDPENFFFP